MKLKSFSAIIAGFVLSAIPAFAQGTTGGLGSMSNFLETYLGYIFFDFNKISLVAFDIWMRVLLWLFLFSVLVWVGRRVFKDKDKPNNRVVNVVALVIATISVFMIPTRILLSIAQTYGIVAIFAFMALPIFGLIYLMYAFFPTSEMIVEKDKDGNKTGRETKNTSKRRNHVIQLIIFYLLATIISNFQSAIAAAPAGAGVAALSTQMLASWHDWTGIAYGVCMIMMMYHLFAALFLAGPEEGGAPSFPNLGGTGQGQGQAQTPQQPALPVPEGATEELASLVGYINELDKQLKDGYKLFMEFVKYYYNLLEQSKNIRRPGHALNDEERNILTNLTEGVTRRANDLGEHDETMYRTYYNITTHPYHRNRNLPDDVLGKMSEVLSRFNEREIIISQFSEFARGRYERAEGKNPEFNDGNYGRE